jgi:hypothetical protein
VMKIEIEIEILVWCVHSGCLLVWLWVEARGQHWRKKKVRHQLYEPCPVLLAASALLQQHAMEPPFPLQSLPTFPV